MNRLPQFFDEYEEARKPGRKPRCDKVSSYAHMLGHFRLNGPTNGKRKSFAARQSKNCIRKYDMEKQKIVMPPQQIGFEVPGKDRVSSKNLRESVREEILRLLKSAPNGLIRAEIYALSSYACKHIAKQCDRLKSDGLIVEEGSDPRTSRYYLYEKAPYLLEESETIEESVANKQILQAPALPPLRLPSFQQVCYVATMSPPDILPGSPLINLFKLNSIPQAILPTSHDTLPSAQPSLNRANVDCARIM